MRFAICALLLLAGCRQFNPPTERGTGVDCTQDSDCGSTAICNAGQCDTTHCHVDAQCDSLFCYGSRDGGVPGACGTRSCFSNTDCPAPEHCEQNANIISCVGGCSTDPDCPAGEICWATGPSSNACEPGCRSSADCDGGPCNAAAAGGIPTCGVSSHCSSAADCPPCSTCSSGFCLAPDSFIDGGLPILGTPSAVKLSDLAMPTVSAIEAALPGSALTGINGTSMHQDGTIDLSNPQDYVARWNFTFSMTDGGSMQVIYSRGFGRCATTTFNDYALGTEIIDSAVVGQLVDPATWETDFLSNANCGAWIGNNSDTFGINGSGDGGGTAFVENRNGQELLGDAVTGQVLYVDCP